jgi:cytochrome c peroxidase
LFAVVTAVFLSVPLLASEPVSLSPKEQLGIILFFDTNLSSPKGQSCAGCHVAGVGFTGPDQAINRGGAVYEGAVKGRFGNRKPSAASYAGDSPVLHFDKEEGVWVGGMFWDGRATGKTLSDPLAEQAQGPFLNPLEQNVADRKTLCTKVEQSSYAPLFENTRDVLGRCEGISVPKPGENCWPAPEVSANVNRDELGKLELSDAEGKAIIAFLKTLTDGYKSEK